MNLSGLKRGDPVRVFERFRSRGTPEGGFQGKVHSVGRKYLVAVYQTGGSREQTCQVRIADGQSPDQWGHYTVQTPEEVEARLVRQRHEETLRSVGLRIDIGKRPSDGLLAALAADVETWGQEGLA